MLLAAARFNKLSTMMYWVDLFESHLWRKGDAGGTGGRQASRSLHQTQNSRHLVLNQGTRTWEVREITAGTAGGTSTCAKDPKRSHAAWGYPAQNISWPQSRSASSHMDVCQYRVSTDGGIDLNLIACIWHSTHCKNRYFTLCYWSNYRRSWVRTTKSLISFRPVWHQMRVNSI